MILPMPGAKCLRIPTVSEDGGARTKGEKISASIADIKAQVSGLQVIVHIVKPIRTLDYQRFR